jgi:CRISPR/Cas system-associated protein endoribonuclease Cas2
MIIKDDDFELVSTNDYDRFDLYITKVINAKNEEKRREELTLEGYSMSFENCMKKVINYKLSKNKEIYKVREYLSEYKRIKDILT